MIKVRNILLDKFNYTFEEYWVSGIKFDVREDNLHNDDDVTPHGWEGTRKEEMLVWWLQLFDQKWFLSHHNYKFLLQQLVPNFWCFAAFSWKLLKRQLEIERMLFNAREDRRMWHSFGAEPTYWSFLWKRSGKRRRMS